MNQVPRRSPRTRPPLRGRLAAVASPRLKQEYSLPVTRKRPAIPRTVRGKKYQDSGQDITPSPSPEPKLWQWLVGLVLLLILLLLVRNLL